MTATFVSYLTFSINETPVILRTSNARPYDDDSFPIKSLPNAEQIPAFVGTTIGRPCRVKRHSRSDMTATFVSYLTFSINETPVILRTSNARPYDDDSSPIKSLPNAEQIPAFVGITNGRPCRDKRHCPTDNPGMSCSDWQDGKNRTNVSRETFCKNHGSDYSGHPRRSIDRLDEIHT